MLRRTAIALIALLALPAVALAQTSPTTLAPLPDLAPLELGPAPDVAPVVKQSTPSVHPAPAPVHAPQSLPIAQVSSGTTTLAPLGSDLTQDLARATTTYHIRAGETLQAALARWCAASGWTLVWKSGQDYRIDADMSFPRGTQFNDAVRETMRSLWRQHHQRTEGAPATPKSSLYARNRVLLLSEVRG